MKYLGMIVLVALLAWSWRLVNHESAISQIVHVSIQQDLKKIIADYIHENLPTAKDLRFDRFWTETVSKDRVKASFLYSFEDTAESTGPARVQIDGYAILNRDAVESNDQSESWSFDELYILNNQVEFKEPLTITPAAAGDETSAEPDQSPNKKEHKAQ